MIRAPVLGLQTWTTMPSFFTVCWGLSYLPMPIPAYQQFAEERLRWVLFNKSISSLPGLLLTCQDLHDDNQDYL